MANKPTSIKESFLSIAPVDIVADAQESALLRIAATLTHPDDLTNKLAMLRKKVAMERASVDAQLKTVMENQLDFTQQGMDAIKSVQNETDTLKAMLETMDQICNDSEGEIKNYAFLQKDLVDKFKTVDSKIMRISKLLDEDSKQIVGPANNLLLIHFELQNLINFRDKILNVARGSSADVLNTLNTLFKKLEQVEYKFDVYFWELAKSTWELIKSGYGCTVVRIIKIIEVMEKADRLLELSVVNLPDKTEALKKLGNYRIKYFDILRQRINGDLEKMMADNNNDLGLVLIAFDSIIETLEVISSDFVPLIPMHYNIFNFYVLEYHRGIYNSIQTLTNNEIDPTSTLELTTWIRNYYEKMTQKFEVSEDLLEPKLLDGREDEYLGAYVRMVRGKLSEWLHNIIETETIEFLDRKIPPESDNSNHYILTGSVIAFQMFNQQLDVVANSKDQLISDIVTECCNAMGEFQMAWTKIIDMEFSKFQHNSPDLNEGLVEYTTALCNDCLRSQEFAEEILARLETINCDSKLKSQNIANVILLNKVNNILEGFAAIQKKCILILVDIIMKDVFPGMSVLHCSQWYEQDVMRLVIGTFEDYCSDLEIHMPEFLFGKLTSEIMEMFMIQYVESFKNKKAQFKIDTAVGKLKADKEMAAAFFSKSKSAKRVTAAFDVIDKIIALIDANPRMLYFEFYALWKQYPDISMDFLEKLLTKREDLNKSGVREIIELCENKTKNEKPEESQPTIFSKIKNS